MHPAVKQLRRRALRSAGSVAKLSSQPIALVDRLNLMTGGRSLEEAVRDRIVFVTGASSGIGEAVALTLGSAGATVILVARSADKLEQARAEIERAGGVAHVHPCDLPDLAAIDRLTADVLDQHGRVDVLVNNAGRSIRRSIDLSYDRFHDFERTMQLNYFAPVRLILRLLPGMRERRRGQIVNISSAGVQTRVPRFSGYIASKAALDTFSDAVQAEALEDRIRFTTIHMPLVRTPMISPTKLYRHFPALTPQEAADLVSKAIIHRPRRLSPPFGHAAAVADAISPQLMDVVRNRGYRMFPDSPPTADLPGAEPGPDEGDAGVSAAGAAFAKATRGVHW
jgi:short-subunit dehydrogenase